MTTAPPTSGATTTLGPETPPEPNATEVQVLKLSFAGSAPVDPGTQQALQINYIFDVANGTTRLVYWYNTTYNGAFSAVARLYDPSGEMRGDTLETCGIPSPGQQAKFSCYVESTTPIKEGSWTLRVTWQVGEANEDFTLDVIGWGPAPAVV